MSVPGTIVLATGNKGKLREMRQILGGLGVELRAVSEVVGYAPDIEETGTTFAENARIKAEAVARLTGLPSLADDSGLEVDALGGRPGVYSARYAGEGADDATKVEKLLGELADVNDGERSARFRCSVCLVDPRMGAGVDAALVVTAEGVLEGRIARSARGDGGFGYDPIFWLSDEGRTLAELSAEEKNARSHRAAALRALVPKVQRAWTDES